MNWLSIVKILLYIAPLSVIWVTPSTLFPFIVGKYVFFRIIVDIAWIAFVFAWARGEIDNIGKLLKEKFRQPLVIAFTALTVIFLLAGLFGVNPSFSFWSNFERGEGGIQLIHLYLFFILLTLVMTKREDWHRMFKIAIIAAIIVILYGIGAGLKYVDADLTEAGRLTGQGGILFETFHRVIGPSFSGETSYRFQGSIGNPAYVAVYLVFIISYTLILFLENEARKKKKFWLFSPRALIALSIVFGIVFFLTATRGAFLGVIAGLLVGGGYLAYAQRNWRKWLLGSIAGILIVVSLLIGFREHELVKNIPGARIFDISFSTENLQNRFVIWKIAFDGFKERPLLGYGAENFIEVFARHYNPRHFDPVGGFGAWYDRAHNIFLDYLIAAGIIGLLSFLAIFVVFYWQSIKKYVREIRQNHRSVETREKIIHALMLAVPAAYLVQGLVLFDIFPTYLNLFLFFAWANFKLQEDNT